MEHIGAAAPLNHVIADAAIEEAGARGAGDFQVVVADATGEKRSFARLQGDGIVAEAHQEAAAAGTTHHHIIA